MRTPNRTLTAKAAVQWIENKTKHPHRMGVVVNEGDADNITSNTKVFSMLGVVKAQTITSPLKWVSYGIAKQMLDGTWGKQQQQSQQQQSQQGQQQGQQGQQGQQSDGEQQQQQGQQDEGEQQQGQQQSDDEQMQGQQQSDDEQQQAYPGEHFNFHLLLKAVEARLNVALIGPAGTGKTTAARRIAERLNLPFAGTSALDDKFELLGYRTATGEVVRTPFREIWEHGGIFIYDEISGSAAQALIAFNSALANGYAFFPDGRIEKHPDCVIVASDNTWGQHDANYVGREPLGVDSRDRFVRIDWPIDEALESSMSTNAEWLALVRRYRAEVAKRGIEGTTVSPRAVLKGQALLSTGLKLKDVCTMTLRDSMDMDDFKGIMSHLGVSV